MLLKPCEDLRIRLATEKSPSSVSPKVTLTKAFTDEKEPEFRTEISYANDIESAF